MEKKPGKGREKKPRGRLREEERMNETFVTKSQLDFDELNSFLKKT